ncbi:MAG: P-loop NTPase fold protein, partial [Erysipelothrix sp.]
MKFKSIIRFFKKYKFELNVIVGFFSGVIAISLFSVYWSVRESIILDASLFFILILIRIFVKTTRKIGFHFKRFIVFYINSTMLLVIFNQTDFNVNILTILKKTPYLLMIIELLPLLFLMIFTNKDMKNDLRRGELIEPWNFINSKININKRKFVSNSEKRLISLFIVLISLPTLLYVSEPNIMLIILVITYFVFRIANGFYYFGMNTIFVGINALDFFEKPLLILDTREKISRNSRVFKLDLRSLLPHNSDILEISASSHSISTCNMKSNLEEHLFDELFVSINTEKSGKYCIEKLSIKYKNSGKEYIDVFTIELRTENVGDEYLITSCLIVDYSSTRLKLRKSFKEYWMSVHEITIEKNRRLINTLGNYYYFDKSEQKSLFQSNPVENRKFLIHDDKFGIGKSAYDTLVVREVKKVPIPVSLWQENYEHEMLFVLFNRIRKKTKMRVMWPSMETLPTFIALITLFLSFSIFLVTKRDLFPTLMKYDFLKVIFITYPELLVLTFGILGFMASILYAPEFMIYKKNSSEYYQDFYLKQIKKMIEKKNLVLIIEDLDRLDIETVEKCFRMIANLNYQFRNSNRVIGILSYDEKVIRNMFSNKYQTATLNSESTNVDYYDVIIEKIAIKKEFNKQSESSKFKQKYLEKLLDFYSMCLIYDLCIPESEIEKMKN